MNGRPDSGDANDCESCLDKTVVQLRDEGIHMMEARSNPLLTVSKPLTLFKVSVCLSRS